MEPAQDNPRRILPLVLTISGMGVLTFSLIAPGLPDLADALGVSRGVIGLVQGAVPLPGIFLAIYIGYLADRKGRRFVGVASLLVFALAGVAGYFTRSLWSLVLVRALQGIGVSGVLSLGMVIIGDMFPAGKERRWALGINSAGLTVTGMVAPIAGGALASIDPFLPFLVYGLGLPVAAWAYAALPGPGPGPYPDRPLRHVAGAFAELRRRGKLIDFAGLLPFGALAMIVVFGVGFTATPLLLEAEFGLDVTARGFYQAAVSVGSTTGALLTSRLTERFGPRRLFNSGFGLIVAGFSIAAAAPVAPMVAPGLLLLGLGLGLVFPLLQEFVASAVPTSHRGAIVGVFVVSIRAGQAVGPVTATGLAQGVGERMTFVIAAAASLFALVAWLPLRLGARRIAARHPGRSG